MPELRAALADAGPDEPRTGMLELRLRARDGGWRWVEGQATLRFRGGTAIAVEITGRDVTRTRAAEDEGRRLVLAARGARRRRARRHHHGRRARPDRGHQRAGVLAARARDAPGGADRPGPERMFASLRRLLADPRPAIARLREIAERGETVRFVFFECADGRRVSFDHVPLGDDGAAGRLWMFRDITQFKLAGGGAARVPGHDEPRDQDAAVGHRRRGRAAAAAPASASASASWPR